MLSSHVLNIAHTAPLIQPLPTPPNVTPPYPHKGTKQATQVQNPHSTTPHNTQPHNNPSDVVSYQYSQQNMS